ncbi:hypothetical protein L6452_15182 [Arctium lappa]|uniref:Uncharacterized protein n=1 Tax=Arctium lappa TaxID=4217 RepID=A0ACB9CMW4_ARCLA|nr:hypothetical protein L6452_15182 [Arctium lappa]
MDYGTGGGTGGSGGGSHHDSSDKKKRYHRHTALQIQILESTFKECPHPDEKTRMQLSRELGLAPRQIKFWFQNRRTQMKAQHERADNCALRAENDKIRYENIVIREALKNLVCPTCGGPPIGEDCYFDEQKLRFENAQLKEELDRVSSIAAKYIGRPMSQLPPVQPIHMSSLDLSMATYGGSTANRMVMMNSAGPSLDLDLLTGSAIGSSSSSINPDPPYHSSVHLSDMDKSIIANISSNAMDELIRLVQTNEPLWTKSRKDGNDVLNLDNYKQVFPRPNDNLKNPNVRIEASRVSGVVMMNSLQLVDMFFDSTKWIEIFPTIVSKARTIEVISSGLGSQNGSLQLMYEELQVLSPLLSTRQFYFLRFCQQIEQGSWAIVNVSYDLPQYNPYTHSRFKAHRLPSGCMIQEMPNGYSKVTWVEHTEIEEIAPIDRLYRDFIHSGLAFGAKRWLACLQRACERIASLMTNSSSHDLGGVVPSAEGKRSMMKLSQRMVNNFCSSINPSNGHQWTSLSGLNEFEVRAILHKSNDPGQPNGMVLSASTTIWLPVPPQTVFDFFRDGRTRPQWDVLSNQNPVQEVAHIANGTHPGNCISVLRAYTPSQNSMLILQESCTDASGSLVVYCPVDLPAINIAMNGEDPSYIPLLPSGFIITTDGHHEITSQGGTAGGASTSNMTDHGGDHGSSTSTGSLITVVFQIQVNSLPAAKMSPESLTTINNLVTNTVHQIKASFNCPSTTT